MGYHIVSSKTFAQASTPSNRIVFTFCADATSTGFPFISDSDLQFTFGPNNASPNPNASNKVQIFPTLIEKVIVAKGVLTFTHNLPGFSSPGGAAYRFETGQVHDFSESGGLPIVISPTVGTGFLYNLINDTVGSTNGITATIILRGYQGNPRN